MLAHLADVSIRSLLLVLAAAIVLWIPRIRRTAALQHAVWTAVLCGMLALFVFGQGLPRLPPRILDSPNTPASSPTAVLDFDRSLLAGTSQLLLFRPAMLFPLPHRSTRCLSNN
jgi:hypothetical protein